MRRRLALLALLLLAPAAVLAQGNRPAAPARAPATPPAATPPAAAAPAANPAEVVLARVDGQPLTMADVLASAEEVLPAELRAMPPEALLAGLPAQVRNQLVERAIAERAMVVAARRQGLDRDPEVARRLRRAEDQELQQQLLTREVQGRVTDAAVRARYDRDFGSPGAGQGAEEEVHARHILLESEAEAKRVLTLVQRGGDFAALARQHSKDPGSREGGDLGFFKRGDMVAEFANAAFALQPGQVSAAPVQSPFGWHIIKVEERRRATPPPFEQVSQELRERLLQEEVNAAVTRIRASVTVERLDQPAAGSLLNQAAPPAAAQPTPTQPQRRR